MQNYILTGNTNWCIQCLLPFRIEHFYLRLTSRGSCETPAGFVCIQRGIFAYSVSGTSELDLSKSTLWGRGKIGFFRKFQTDWNHRHELIPTDETGVTLKPITTQCFCFFEPEEWTGKWVQVLTTSFSCAPIEHDHMAYGWHSRFICA